MMTPTIFFVPGNPSHVATQVPVARELCKRGHRSMFLCRDAVSRPEFHTEKALVESGMPFKYYESYYRSDVDLTFPKIQDFQRSRQAVFAFLRKIPFDFLVTCNDDSTLFDRLVVHFACSRRRGALLIQESVRPDLNPLPVAHYFTRNGLVNGIQWIALASMRTVTPPGFVRRGYGHSGCTLIATAGERFKRMLIAQKVPVASIHVTGQPRLDGLFHRSNPVCKTRRTDCGKTLLFCHQPVPVPDHIRNQLVRDVITAAVQIPGTRVILKLHREDPPPDYWRSVIPEPLALFTEVLQSDPLQELFTRSDAMVTIASTTALEAMAAGVPVALINYLPIFWHLPYAQSGAALGIETPSELGPKLKLILFDETVRDSLVAKAPSVLRDELYLMDGNSAARIASLIEMQVNGGKRPQA